jgi:peptidoglycan/xylan/chitin deacetylase (PgdA/CDA1 family)
MSTWPALRAELSGWRDAGRTAELWWRDDDASTLTPPLERLLALSASAAVPLALAVIPLACRAEIFAGAPCVLMHGCDHRNRAPSGEKKTEFPASESDEDALARLAAARERLARMAGERFMPALAPPWNRFKRSLVPRLPGIGIHGLSAYGPSEPAPPGIRQVNTHLDIIAWRGNRGFIGEQQAVGILLSHLAARRRGAIEEREPAGLLTHHAVHDADAWRFIERLFDETRASGARWVSPRELFPSPV